MDSEKLDKTLDKITKSFGNKWIMGVIEFLIVIIAIMLIYKFWG